MALQGNRTGILARAGRFARSAVPTRSIGTVLIGLAALGVAVTLCLAGFGIAGARRQAAAMDDVMTLTQALHNHGQADAFMDGIRTDVLRALLAGTANKEGVDAIRADSRHHLEVVERGIAQNRALALGADLHAGYADIARLAAPFVAAGRAAVDLALADPVAGAGNYERFRASFTALEDAMDAMRDRLDARVDAVRAIDRSTSALVRKAIVGAAAAGILLLLAVSATAMRIVRDIVADLARSREQAQHAALHDTLTGLPNRTLLAERLGYALAHSRRHGGRLAVLSLDLDGFKQVNDTLGHHAGDALLRAVAGRLRGCMRECDTVARLGGDEFAVVQTAIAAAPDVAALSQRLIAALAAPYDIEGQRVTVGASVGFALCPGDASEAEQLLQLADIALYRAKADGRGIFRSFEAGMDASLQARRRFEAELREAVEAQAFSLHYQPLVSLDSGKVTAFEALLRWQHPQRGNVTPAEFIPLAEETGLIVPLGGWVLQQACLAATGWPEQVRVAVNLSAMQFKADGLVAAVADALAGSGLAAERLELEITETSLLADSKATLLALRQLRALGVRIAMDDFGTGYSSLGYLRSFPFDKIKIDQSFVRDIDASRDCKAIVRAVTGLGLSLAIATTAEGVETWEQFDQVRLQGCEEAQGFLFSRPVPAAQVLTVLQDIEGTMASVATGVAGRHEAERHEMA